MLSHPEHARCMRFKVVAPTRWQPQEPLLPHGESSRFHVVSAAGRIDSRPHHQVRDARADFSPSAWNATTIELDSSHVSLVSHPNEIADLILMASGRKKSQ